MAETKHTPLDWKQGKTLSTPNTRHWSKGQIEYNDSIESLMIFANFTESDNGKSRKLICTVNPQTESCHANAEMIVKSVNSHNKLVEALERQISDRDEWFELFKDDFEEINGVTAEQTAKFYVARTEELRELLKQVKE